MKWKVEVITSESSNVLVDNPALRDEDKEPVGMGFPLALAERLVKMHNEALEKKFQCGSCKTMWKEHHQSYVCCSV